MTNYIKDITGTALVKCDCCGETVPSIQIHEHHMVKRSSMGSDAKSNIAFIDSYCHTAVHQIEAALKNPKRNKFIPDLLVSLFPDNPLAQKNCLYLATTAAMGRPLEASASQLPDYSQWDEDNLVHLTPPPTVHPQTRQQVKIVAKEIKNPRTGRALGVGGYLRMLVEADLKKRGFKIISAFDLENTKKPVDKSGSRSPISEPEK